MTEEKRFFAEIEAVADEVERRFRAGRRSSRSRNTSSSSRRIPSRYARDASRYLRDVFEHYGTTQVEYPWGEFTRYRLFDLPWEKTRRAAKSTARRAHRPGARAGRDPPRALELRARGQARRLVLLHGPNGSAKSTIVGCLMRALENYSHARRRRALPLQLGLSRRTRRCAARSASVSVRRLRDAHRSTTYAHLADDQIDAKLLVEVRDHPLFLIPGRRAPRAARASYDAREGDGQEPEPPPRLDPARPALPQEPAGLRGAARQLRRLVHARC